MSECDRPDCSDPITRGREYILEVDGEYKHYCSKWCAFFDNGGVAGEGE